MTQFADVVLNDGAATPAPKVFAARARDGNVFTWLASQLSVSSVGWGRLRLRQSIPNIPTKGDKATKLYKIDVMLDIPTLEVLGVNDQGITPPPTVAYSGQVRAQIILPDRSTAAERAHYLAYFINALNSAPVKNAVVDFNMVI